LETSHTAASHFTQESYFITYLHSLNLRFVIVSFSPQSYNNNSNYPNKKCNSSFTASKSAVYRQQKQSLPPGKQQPGGG
jgi:hypothetical protein